MTKMPAIALVGAAVLALGACSGGDASGGASSSTAESSTESSTSAAATSAAESSAPATEGDATTSAPTGGDATAPASGAGDATATAPTGSGPAASGKAAGMKTVTSKSGAYTASVPAEAEDFLKDAPPAGGDAAYEMGQKGSPAHPFSVVGVGQPKGNDTLANFAKVEACDGVAKGMKGTATPAPDRQLGGEPAKGCTIASTGTVAQKATSYAVMHGNRKYLILISEQATSVDQGSTLAEDVLGSIAWR